jgi:hypothetical protein
MTTNQRRDDEVTTNPSLGDDMTTNQAALMMPPDQSNDPGCGYFAYGMDLINRVCETEIKLHTSQFWPIFTMGTFVVLFIGRACHILLPTS